MRPNKLRELLRAGQPTLGTHIHSAWPATIELVGHSGLFDYVEFPEQAKPYLDQGVRHFCMGWDVEILFDWFKREGDTMRKILEGR
jgi:2-keto-3-deoxy-L-rhamnonate aldolase RhmA